jgi:steroid delta-isomerase-like uncharacterized protein
MTTDEIRAFVSRHVEKFHLKDVVGLAADFTEDGVVESPSSGTHTGRRQIAESYERLLAAFPDAVFTVESVMAEGDQAAVVFHFAASHQGAFLGLPATGKRIEFRGVFLDRFEHDLLVHERRLYDFSGLLINLGILQVKRQ